MQYESSGSGCTLGTSYAQLHARLKHIGDLNHALSMLYWDEAAMMPPGGGAGRAEALATLASLVHDRVSAMVVPGSFAVKRQAEAEGLDAIFREAGFDWREAGCSMCLGMNPDILAEGQRCASTSNRNFEGRQGKGGRTHLVSPAMAAAAAIEGRFVDVRTWR